MEIKESGRAAPTGRTRAPAAAVVVVSASYSSSFMAARFLVHLILVTAATSAAAATSPATNATAGPRVPAAPGDDGGNVTGFSFSGFVSANRGANVTVLGDANINQGALQITPDSLNDAATFLTHKSGRVFYATPFRLWQREGHGGEASSEVDIAPRVRRSSDGLHCGARPWAECQLGLFESFPFLWIGRRL